MPLSKVRKEIDEIDQALIKLFKKRNKVMEKVAKIKKKNGIPITQKIRESEIEKKLEHFSKKHNLNKKFLQKIWKNMIDEAKDIQKKIVK